FVFASHADHPALHSFPTRRSSDLLPPPADQCLRYSPRRRTRLRANGTGSREFCREIERRDHGEVCTRRPLRRQRWWCHEALRLRDRKSTRLNSSHVAISYAVFCLK